MGNYEVYTLARLLREPMGTVLRERGTRKHWHGPSTNGVGVFYAQRCPDSPYGSRDWWSQPCMNLAGREFTLVRRDCQCSMCKVAKHRQVTAKIIQQAEAQDG